MTHLNLFIWIHEFNLCICDSDDSTQTYCNILDVKYLFFWLWTSPIIELDPCIDLSQSLDKFNMED